jgi:hypothetical protein
VAIHFKIHFRSEEQSKKLTKDKKSKSAQSLVTPALNIPEKTSSAPKTSMFASLALRDRYLSPRASSNYLGVNLSTLEKEFRFLMSKFPKR